MKKEKSPILVIFCIFLLSLLVILPPTFRALIPKDETTNPSGTEQNQPKLVIVNCNRIYQDELYQVVSKTKYVGGVLNSNVITYQLLQALPEGFVASEITPPTTATADLTYFKSLQGVSITENNNTTIITLDNKLLTTNPTDQTLSNYIQSDYELQKQTYENLGYKCNLLES